MYNFCEFKELIESNSLVQNGDISSDTYWTIDDTSPVGANEQAWSYNAGTYQNSDALITDWTNGLSQSVNIKANKKYLFDLVLQGSGVNDVTFYVLLVDGSNYVTAHTQIVNNETKYIQFNYTPANNYDKIMLVAHNSGGGASFVCRVYSFNIYDYELLFNNDCSYALPLVEDDVVKGYTNFDIDDNDYAFSSLKLGLYSNGFYLYDIATLNQVVVSGDIYNVHFEWTVPVLPKGNYRFVLYEDTEDIHYISNSFRYTANKTDTAIIKYRNTKNTLGYLYETATTYYNQYRIDFYRGKPLFPTNSQGYSTYDGGFITTKSDIQKQIEYVLPFASEEILEALNGALLHDEFYIDSVEFEKPNGENVAIAYSEDDLKIGTGTVNLREVSYSNSIESC